jgi:AICAR transformylase/IMP cyclohydrolase PurH (only IMP cyclohydrolase domain in Aful)
MPSKYIDIGGPAMVGSSAKDHAFVGVVTHPSQSAEVIEAIQDGGLSRRQREELAKAAFQHTATYDGAIANYLGNDPNAPNFPEQFFLGMVRDSFLRHGENPHQQAAFYRDASVQEACIGTAVQRAGKALSFNNIADTDAALECVRQFEAPACVIVKHANPCGVAVDTSSVKAYKRAFATDPTSAFGGIIAFNRVLELETATAILDQQFVEVIIAARCHQ